MNNNNSKVNSATITLFVNLLVGGLTLFGVEVSDKESFTQAVVAGIAGIIMVATSVTYIIAHFDYKKTQSNNVQ